MKVSKENEESWDTYLPMHRKISAASGENISNLIVITGNMALEKYSSYYPIPTTNSDNCEDRDWSVEKVAGKAIV